MAPKASRPVAGQEPHSAPTGPTNPLPTGQPHDPNVQREVLRRKLEARHPGRTAESDASQASLQTAEPTAPQVAPKAPRPRQEVSVDESDTDPEGPPPKRPTAQRPPPLEPAPEDAEMEEADESEDESVGLEVEAIIRIQDSHRAAGAWASDDGEAGSTHGASELMDLEPEPDAAPGEAHGPQQAPRAPDAGAPDATATEDWRPY